MAIRIEEDDRPAAERPFQSGRVPQLLRVGLDGLQTMKKTGVLFDSAKIGQGTIRLRVIQSRLGGEAASVGGRTAALRLGRGDTSIGTAFDGSLAAAPVISKETGIASGTFADLAARHDDCVIIAFSANEASNQGLDALRLSNGIAQSLISAALAHLRVRLSTASADDRQKLLARYGAFIATVNANDKASAKVRARNEAVRGDLDAKISESQAQAEALNTTRRVKSGAEVPVAEAAAASRTVSGSAGSGTVSSAGSGAATRAGARSGRSTSRARR